MEFSAPFLTENPIALSLQRLKKKKNENSQCKLSGLTALCSPYRKKNVRFALYPHPPKLSTCFADNTTQSYYPSSRFALQSGCVIHESRSLKELLKINAKKIDVSLKRKKRLYGPIIVLRLCGGFFQVTPVLSTMWKDCGSFRAREALAGREGGTF